MRTQGKNSDKLLGISFCFISLKFGAEGAGNKEKATDKDKKKKRPPMPALSTNK